MSDSARYHAQQAARTASTEGLQVLIAEIEESPAWKGCEFDDARVRHKARTRLEVYRAELASRLADRGAVGSDLSDLTNRELAQAADQAREDGKIVLQTMIAAEMASRNQRIGRAFE